MLSLAITHYNRYEMVIESFAQIIDDFRLSEILIMDDASTDGSFEKLAKHFEGDEKVGVIRQAKNRGMQTNKRDAIALAKHSHVIILDSDNIIDTTYIDALEKMTFDEYTIFCPVFARPQFDFRKFSGMTFDITNVGKYMKDDVFNMAMNCCNYVVNKLHYVSAFQFNEEHICTDTAWFNYNWLRYGGKFHFVPGMEYTHRVHPGSGFLQDAGYNMKKANEVRKLIMAL